MAKHNWSEVTKEDVIKAIELFDTENPDYPAPRSTFLLYGNKKYPAKHIRGMAYKVHYGVEISKEDFTGGQETVRFFERLGFDMQYVHKSVNTHPDKIKNTLDRDAADNNNQAEETNKQYKAAELHDNKDGLGNLKSDDHKQDREKITIPAKEVIEQKNALQLLLNKICDGDIVCEKTYSWMKTPLEISGEYVSLCKSLKEYRGNDDFAKKNVTLRCDFVCESRKLIIEYDERQHFSEARRRSLMSYEDIELDYDRELWIRACEDIQAKDNQPKNRDEVRAYYDSTRDIEASKHGYKLIRIMHGRYDFKKPGAEKYLKDLIKSAYHDEENAHQTDTYSLEMENEIAETTRRVYERETFDTGRKEIKIGMYLQTYNVCNQVSFDKAIEQVKKSDIDILVLPEIAYVPFYTEMRNADFFSDDVQGLFEKGLELSKKIGRSIVFCQEDRYGTIMSIYANAFAKKGETPYKAYIKHTMTDRSACEIENYPEYMESAFEPIIYKGCRIGLTICYDCNHAMFSRKYGLNKVDIIINCTGGDVVYDKWYKYNKVRSIENHAFSFVTMSGPNKEKSHNYVFGFTPEGRGMLPKLLDGSTPNANNISGAIYVYDTSDFDCRAEIDPGINQTETVNKRQDLFISENGIGDFTAKGTDIAGNIKVISHERDNIILCKLNGEDIMKPEVVLPLLYDRNLGKLKNKRYIIINHWDELDDNFYKTKLSPVLKVRSMENYCAVILDSPTLKKCYQCGMNRTAQVVRSVDGNFGIDLSRTSGPEAIWKNKPGMKACWRDNIEYLIDSMKKPG